MSTSGSGSVHRIDISLADLDTIPDYDEFAQRAPPAQDLSGSVLENPTAIFNLDYHRGRAEALGEVDVSPFEEEDDLNYIRDIETTITNTWLILYSTIIRILNILVNLSLSYEKHSLSILRAFSIIALVVCCRRDVGCLSKGAQDTVDSMFSILLLPLLLFNTTFDLYKRTKLIVNLKMFTTTMEYFVVASVASSQKRFS